MFRWYFLQQDEVRDMERYELELSYLMRPCLLVQALHHLEPCPYFLGRENQIFS